MPSGTTVHEERRTPYPDKAAVSLVLTAHPRAAPSCRCSIVQAASPIGQRNRVMMDWSSMGSYERSAKAADVHLVMQWEWAQDSSAQLALALANLPACRVSVDDDNDNGDWSEEMQWHDWARSTLHVRLQQKTTYVCSVDPELARVQLALPPTVMNAAAHRLLLCPASRDVCARDSDATGWWAGLWRGAPPPLPAP